MGKRKVNLAILDMYDGEPNQGMRCIHEILSRFSDEISYREFDVRGKAELPDIRNFDLFISTGGPGNPLEGDGHWDLLYNEFLDQIWIWNQNHSLKKHLLLIVFFENTSLQTLASGEAGNIERLYEKVIAEKFILEKKGIVKELQRYGIQALLTAPEKLTVDVVNKYLQIKARREI